MLNNHIIMVNFVDFRSARWWSRTSAAAWRRPRPWKPPRPATWRRGVVGFLGVLPWFLRRGKIKNDEIWDLKEFTTKNWNVIKPMGFEHDKYGFDREKMPNEVVTFRKKEIYPQFMWPLETAFSDEIGFGGFQVPRELVIRKLWNHGMEVHGCIVTRVGWKWFTEKTLWVSAARTRNKDVTMVM